MKRISLSAAAFVFAAIFAVTASAQVPAQTVPAGSGKIGIVVTEEFGAEKGGITKFKAAMATLVAEFKPVNDKLRTMGTRFETLRTEIEQLQKTVNAPGVPVGNATAASLNAKVEEAQTLETQIKREEEDAKAKYSRRYSVVIGPIFGDIVKAMNEYAKKNGYAVILDGMKLDQAQILLGFDEKYNVTQDFIAFYNARPATAATAAAVPK